MFWKILIIACVLIALVVVINPARLSPMKEHWSDLFSTSAPTEKIYVESDESRTQILYQAGDTITELSKGSANASNPFRRGDFVVWVESPQDRSEKYIIRYHLPTKTELKVTTDGVAESPKVNTQGNVVWQQWKDGVWQIAYFDGHTTQSVTSGIFNAVTPDIAGSLIVYTQQQSDGKWSVERFNTQTKEIDRVREPSGDALPYFEGETLVVKK